MVRHGGESVGLIGLTRTRGLVKDEVSEFRDAQGDCESSCLVIDIGGQFTNANSSYISGNREVH